MRELCAVAQLGHSPFLVVLFKLTKWFLFPVPFHFPPLEIMLKDYYAILGVVEDASPAEIKLQYQKLLLIVMSHFSFEFLQHNTPFFFVLTLHTSCSTAPPRQAAAEAAGASVHT